MSTQDRDLGYKKIMHEMRELARYEVKVGIQSDAGADKEGNFIIDRAVANEFGTSKIPERSFIRSAFDMKRFALRELINRLTNGVKEQKLSAKLAAEILGQKHEEDIKDRIDEITSPELSPVTIAKKGSSKPLIESSQMKNSVRFVAVKK